MHILLTGATGLLGKCFLNTAAVSNQVTALVRTAQPAQPGINFCVADLSKPLNRSDLPTSIDAVVHLAQSLEYRNFPNGALDIFNLNVAATAACLDYAKNAGAKYFFYASTGSIYEPYESALVEETQVSPQSYYALSKLLGEKLLVPYQDIFTTCAFRLFFLYDVNGKANLISNLIARTAAKNSQLLLMAMMVV